MKKPRFKILLFNMVLKMKMSNRVWDWHRRSETPLKCKICKLRPCQEKYSFTFTLSGQNIPRKYIPFLSLASSSFLVSGEQLAITLGILFHCQKTRTVQYCINSFWTSKFPNFVFFLKLSDSARNWSKGVRAGPKLAGKAVYWAQTIFGWKMGLICKLASYSKLF